MRTLCSFLFGIIILSQSIEAQAFKGAWIADDVVTFYSDNTFTEVTGTGTLSDIQMGDYSEVGSDVTGLELHFQFFELDNFCSRIEIAEFGEDALNICYSVNGECVGPDQEYGYWSDNGDNTIEISDEEGDIIDNIPYSCSDNNCTLYFSDEDDEEPSYYSVSLSPNSTDPDLIGNWIWEGMIFYYPDENFSAIVDSLNFSEFMMMFLGFSITQEFQFNTNNTIDQFMGSEFSDYCMDLGFPFPTFYFDWSEETCADSGFIFMDSDTLSYQGCGELGGSCITQEDPMNYFTSNSSIKMPGLFTGCEDEEGEEMQDPYGEEIEDEETCLMYGGTWYEGYGTGVMNYGFNDNGNRLFQYLAGQDDYGEWQFNALVFELVENDMSNPISNPGFTPENMDLTNVYPNPFNPTTTVSYLVPEFSKVEIGVYNLQGKLVSVLVNEYSSSGEYDTMWNAEGNPSGIYFITSKIGNVVNIKRVTLLK